MPGRTFFNHKKHKGTPQKAQNKTGTISGVEQFQ